MAGCCGGTRGALEIGNAEGVRAEVRERYAAAARAVTERSSGCCGTSGCDDPISGNLYDEPEGKQVPAGALAASLGCGNPTALAELKRGEVVLDLGSGGGIDVLLTARRVGPEGRAYGLDMTDEMLELARANQRESGIENAEFLKGHIEDVPLQDASVDVITSNCVINLSPEKERVLREAFRVLRPGGRLAIADMIFRREPAAAVREAADLWGACMGGAMTEADYRSTLSAVGFEEIEVEITREYGRDLFGGEPELESIVDELERSGLAAAYVRGRKP